MTKISTLFWDVGGVLLTNGWDREIRRRAIDEFQLDWEDFRGRHELVDHNFETGRISLDAYLACTVFHQKRSFTPEDFKAYMFKQSTTLSGGLDVLGRLSKTGHYTMATLNNESLELNLHRIETFRLREYFQLFISSCFVGLQKPEPAMYRLSLNLCQRDPAECVFIDDRALNVERARELGINAIQYKSPEQLTADLATLGVHGE
jgi:putative hydrolase of the HAD superfamily